MQEVDSDINFKKLLLINIKIKNMFILFIFKSKQ